MACLFIPNDKYFIFTKYAQIAFTPRGIDDDGDCLDVIVVLFHMQNELCVHIIAMIVVINERNERNVQPVLKLIEAYTVQRKCKQLFTVLLYRALAD